MILIMLTSKWWHAACFSAATFSDGKPGIMLASLYSAEACQLCPMKLSIICHAVMQATEKL
jgi:hypothetical protein